MNFNLSQALNYGLAASGAAERASSGATQRTAEILGEFYAEKLFMARDRSIKNIYDFTNDNPSAAAWALVREDAGVMELFSSLDKTIRTVRQDVDEDDFTRKMPMVKRIANNKYTIPNDTFLTQFEDLKPDEVDFYEVNDDEYIGGVKLKTTQGSAMTLFKLREKITPDEIEAFNIPIEQEEEEPELLEERPRPLTMLANRVDQRDTSEEDVNYTFDDYLNAEDPRNYFTDEHVSGDFEYASKELEKDKSFKLDMNEIFGSINKKYLRTSGNDIYDTSGID